MKTYRDEAVVLYSHKLGEADKVVTLLSLHNGKIRAVAKGVRRASSRFGARLEPFMRLDLQLHRGRNLDIVTQAVTLGAYTRGLSDSYDHYCVANVLVELADRLVDDQQSRASEQYFLLISALQALANRQYSPYLIMDSYMIRALSQAGWTPSLTDCAVCGEPGPHDAFSVAQGGVVCLNCRAPGARAPSAAVLAQMRALAEGQWDNVEYQDETVQQFAGQLIANFVQFHLEYTIKSLRLISRQNDSEARPDEY